MKAVLKNLMTGEEIPVSATTETPDSSYGIPCWVDEEGNSYGQIIFGAPLGFEIVSLVLEDPSEAASILGKKTSARKAMSSRENGKKGGRPKKHTT